MEPWQEFDRGFTSARVDQGDGARPGTPMIDLGRALDLLRTAAVTQRHVVHVRRGPASVVPGRGFRGPRRLVGRCLSLAGVEDGVLDALDGHPVRELYRRGALPVQLTLGALVLFDAAQRGEDRGYASEEAFDYAVGVAERFLDLIPRSTFSDGLMGLPSGGLNMIAGPEQTERS
jgi:hypothetical protein